MTRAPIPGKAAVDQDGKEHGTMFLLPAAEGTCEFCATKHEPELPHNGASLFYHTRFFMEHGRYPTWKDATAHCSEDLRERWHAALVDMGIDVEGGGIYPKNEKG